MATTKTSAPITPAIAAQQASWHCFQSAGHFRNSERGKNATSRASARRRFIEDVRLALPAMGLEAFLESFNRHDYQYAREAEPIIRELWAELQIKSAIAGQPAEVVPAPIVSGDAVKAALTNAKYLFAIGQEQIEAALRLIDEAKPASGEIETRQAQ